MKILKLLVLAALFLNLATAPLVHAAWSNVMPAWNSAWCSAPANSWGSYLDKGIKYYPPPDYVIATCPYVQSGYTCSKYGESPRGTFMMNSWNGYTCTRDNYSATQSGAFTLIGKNVPSTVTTYSIQMHWEAPSPFIYFHNAPEGEVAVRLDSALDSYAPLPVFNQENGWDLTVEAGQVSLEESPVNHLFYELALNKISLTRHGRNFTSKDEVISYLSNSDFLTKLGFSEIEKQNSLGYLIPEIQKASDTEYYYLTVLDPASIAETSTLLVTPEPDKIDRKYFAVYPTAVPVSTDGDFVFPQVESIEGFTVRETGEFLINSGMFVFFK